MPLNETGEFQLLSHRGSREGEVHAKGFARLDILFGDSQQSLRERRVQTPCRGDGRVDVEIVQAMSIVGDDEGVRHASLKCSLRSRNRVISQRDDDLVPADGRGGRVRRGGLDGRLGRGDGRFRRGGRFNHGRLGGRGSRTSASSQQKGSDNQKGKSDSFQVSSPKVY